MVVDRCFEGMYDLIDRVVGVQLRDDVDCVCDDDENTSNSSNWLASYIRFLSTVTRCFGSSFDRLTDMILGASWQCCPWCHSNFSA